MARTGLAAAEFLSRQGATVIVSDHKPIEALEAEIQLLERRHVNWEAGGHSDDVFARAELIVVSPGVPLQLPALQQARQAGKEIISEIELASRYLRGKTIAITGTNGKTTTTTLVGEILKTAGFTVQVGGNIGTALVSLVESSSAQTWNVVEVSSFQLEAIPSFRPNIAVILNITPDHLDRYASFEAYAQAKLNIFRNQRASDFAVINQEDASLQQAAASIPAKVAWFSGKRKVPDGAYFDGKQLILNSGLGSQTIVLRDEVPLKGQHNLENVAAAITAAHLAGAVPVKIGDAIKKFKAVEHRLEPVAEIDGVSFYNDSKATNVDATIKALEAFDSGLVVILGGRDKGGDFRALAPFVEKRVKTLVLLGEASSKIRSQLSEAVPMLQARTMEEAVRVSFEQAEAGNTVLLAPACASFDMFEDYQHRGREFKAAVAKLRQAKVHKE
jgi:UDP-N-acetylmuramoylalanine--D-glutamate ligase